jgi:hypothetical protein
MQRHVMPKPTSQRPSVITLHDTARYSTGASNPSVGSGSAEIAYIEGLKQEVHDGLGTGCFSDMKFWPLLILDDAAGERDPTGFGIDKLNTLLNMRVGKWTSPATYHSTNWQTSTGGSRPES